MKGKFRVVCDWCEETVTAKPKGREKLIAHIAEKHPEKMKKQQEEDHGN